MKKLWRLFTGEWCEHCDIPLLIYTSPDCKDGYGYMDDTVKCIKCESIGAFKPKQVPNIKWLSGEALDVQITPIMNVACKTCKNPFGIGDAKDLELQSFMETGLHEFKEKIHVCPTCGTKVEISRVLLTPEK